MAAAGLADKDEQAFKEEEKATLDWVLSGGLDYASAYMHRGYLHQDSGLILQPYATAGCAWPVSHDLIVTPYVTFWNSIDLDAPRPSPGVVVDDPCAILHHHNGLGQAAFLDPVARSTGIGTDWYQSELMFGATARTLNFLLDVKYTLYAYPTGAFFPIGEIGGKASYDVASFFHDPCPDPEFRLRPFFGIYRETFNRYDKQATYAEFGVEPYYRCELCGRRVGIAVPAQVGVSLDNYYVAADGGNEFWG